MEESHDPCLSARPHLTSTPTLPLSTGSLSKATMSPRSTLLTAFLLLTLLATTLTLVTELRWGRELFNPGYPRKEVTSKVEDHLDDVENTRKVSLEVHIMSKCPDAKDCLEMLIAPAMEKIEDIVDFRMSFIGRYVIPSI